MATTATLMTPPSQSWDEWAQKMLNSMSDTTKALADLSLRISSIEKAQAVAEVKYGILGSLAGFLGGILTVMLSKFFPGVK